MALRSKVPSGGTFCSYRDVEDENGDGATFQETQQPIVPSTSRGDIRRAAADRLKRMARTKLGGNIMKVRNRAEVVDHADPKAEARAGGQERSPSATTSELLQCRMAERQRDYTKMDSLRVFCGTWNVNGKPATSVKKFLLHSNPPMDVYAVGFQELDLRAEALVLNESDREKDWIERIGDALGPSYVQLKSLRLVGMLLVVFVRQDLRGNFRAPEAHCVGTGLMRKMGNKGGVAVRVDYSMTRLCFVSSHLAAHQEEIERRNEDFHDIMSRITFSDETGIADCDAVIWMGDLNYRLENQSVMSDSQVRKLAASDYEKLHHMDQLLEQRKLGLVFQDFSEGSLDFQPSYKYDPGTDDFDTSEKFRNPAWCDRVLFRGSNINVVEYRSYMSLQLSDHKPVSAKLIVPVCVSDPALEKLVYAEEMFAVDRMANTMMPQVELSDSEVIFNELKFLEVQTQTIRVENTGRVPCHFEFVPQHGKEEAAPSWLKLRPASSVLMPGRSMSLSFSAAVHPRQVAEFNNNPKRDCILILHLENSRDFFINVSADFVPSVFGMSLFDLTFLQELPTRESQTTPTRMRRSGALSGPKSEEQGQRRATGMLKKSESANSILSDKPPAVPAVAPRFIPVSALPETPRGEKNLERPPRPLWVMVEMLIEKGVETVDIFVSGASHKDVVAVREVLDSRDFDSIHKSMCPRGVAEALLIFLEALPEPIVPVGLQAACISLAGHSQNCKDLIATMPLLNVLSFTKLMLLLRMLVEKSAKNHLPRATIISLFADVIFHAPQTREAASQRSRAKKLSQFLGHFI